MALRGVCMAFIDFQISKGANVSKMIALFGKVECIGDNFACVFSRNLYLGDISAKRDWQFDLFSFWTCFHMALRGVCMAFLDFQICKGGNVSRIIALFGKVECIGDNFACVFSRNLYLGDNSAKRNWQFDRVFILDVFSHGSARCLYGFLAFANFI